MESLLALLVHALILMLIGFTLQTLNLFQQNLYQEKNIEWHLFLNQMEKDMEDKYITFRGKSELHFIQKDRPDKYTYVTSGAQIQRKKNGTGYTPMLMQIKEVKYEDGKNGVHVQVDFKNGQIMRGYVPVEEKPKSE